MPGGGNDVGAELHTLLAETTDSALYMLAGFVAQDSQWSNPEGVSRLGGEVSAYLEELGFAMRTVPQDPIPPDRAWLAEVLAPGVRYETLAPTFVASRPGTGDARVLLLGDLDTAFSAADGPAFAVREGKAYGTGVADMKAGLVTLLSALQAMDQLDVPSPPLDVVLSGDEQAGSLGSSAVIAPHAEIARWTLCMECARDGGKYMVARGHIGVGLLEVTGVASHAGTARSSGVSAARALAELIPALEDLTSYEAGRLVTATILSSGTRRSVVPGKATAVLDLRATDQSGWITMGEGLRNIVDSYSAAGISVDLRTAVHRPGVISGPDTDELVEQLRSVTAFMGEFPGTTRSSAAGSSAFAASGGSTVLDGMGPPGGDLMTPGEYVEIEGITERAAALGAILHRLAAGSGELAGSTRAVHATEGETR